MFELSKKTAITTWITTLNTTTIFGVVKNQVNFRNFPKKFFWTQKSLLNTTKQIHFLGLSHTGLVFFYCQNILYYCKIYIYVISYRCDTNWILYPTVVCIFNQAKMQALFRIPLLGVKFVSQQSGLCVFRCRLLFCTFF